MRKTFALVLVALLVVAGGGRALAATQLLETGSTLLYPLMNLWVADYQNSHKDVQITTQGTGSGTGISQAISGTAQIGASDAYLSSGQMAQNPQMLNIPLAISAQMINYNVPGIGSGLNLSGPVLAGIYSGQIKFWDDAKIKDINKSMGSKLPHKEIVPIHRSEGSGDTFIFSAYLTASAGSAWSGGMGTTISWPSVSTAVGATGNPGMLSTCQNTQYSIAYIGIAYEQKTDAAGLGKANLLNKDGKFVAPTDSNVKAAADIDDKSIAQDGRQSLIFASGANSYPIVNFEYAIVSKKQADAGKAKELKSFLIWALEGGQDGKFIHMVHFQPLPGNVVRLSKGLINQIQ